MFAWMYVSSQIPYRVLLQTVISDSSNMLIIQPLTRLVDLGDRHCFARTLCNSRRASRAPCDFPLSLFLFLLIFPFLCFLAMFLSDFCTINYHDFLRKLHRNRTVVSPSEAIYVWWRRSEEIPTRGIPDVWTNRLYRVLSYVFTFLENYNFRPRGEKDVWLE